VERPKSLPRIVPSTIPELDGLRGLAILLVIVCHTQWTRSSTVDQILLTGRIGVDLFFVLSGFLITRILFAAKEREHAFRNFYARRILRIWPLYFLYLAVVFVGLRWILPGWVRPWPFFLFVQNSVYRSYVGPLLQPTWSLAVEEQFYLLWPLVVLKRSPRTALWVCAVCLGISPVIRLAASFLTTGFFLEFNTLVRLDSIALGCFIASLLTMRSISTHAWRRIGLGMALAGTAGTTICILPSFTDTRLGYAFGYSFIALLFGGILLLALGSSPQGSFRRVLRGTWLRYCGRISFALYLFNFGIITMFRGNHPLALLSRLKLPPPELDVLINLLAYGAMFIAATMSWYLLESPILRLKRLFR